MKNKVTTKDVKDIEREMKQKPVIRRAVNPQRRFA